jgi:AcrR family transcriptional regulator
MGRPKESDREDIRSLVLEKAKSLFLKEGYAKITIRKIAQSIGYTPATIYLYFQNKDEILYELHNEGFKLLYQYKMKAGDSDKAANAMERLNQGGLNYIDFALENPDYYELMFNMPEPRNFMVQDKSGKTDDYAMRAYKFLKQSIQMCQDEGYFKDIDTDTAAFTFWSLVHGMVALILQKRVPYPQAPSRQLAREAIEFFGRMILSGRFADEVKTSLKSAEGMEISKRQ